MQICVHEPAQFPVDSLLVSVGIKQMTCTVQLQSLRDGFLSPLALGTEWELRLTTDNWVLALSCIL